MSCCDEEPYCLDYSMCEAVRLRSLPLCCLLEEAAAHLEMAENRRVENKMLVQELRERANR